ncbi:MAG: YwiC-like family protein [Acidobacteria bacterium]|nr:YwiC-like family protein [Acidobacteriota bacterium]
MSNRLAVSGVRLRPIALPMEHGGWGFLLEPILLGLILAWSGRGLALSLAAIAGFLLRQPLKVWWSDVVASRAIPRTRVAIAIAVVYGVIGAAGAVLAFRGALDAGAPLLYASPLVALLLWFDARGRSRDLVPELVAPVALASVAASIAMLGGWPRTSALALSALLALRAFPSVLYVRSRLRLEHGRDPNRYVPLAVHAVAVAIVLWIARIGLVPVWVPLLYALLLLRCWAGLSSLRRRFGARSVGFSEVRWGTIAVIWIALAFRLA